MKNSLNQIGLSLSLMLISGFVGWKANSIYHKDIESTIIQRETAEHLAEEWGNLIVYTPEEVTTTFGTKNMLTAVAEIKPGEQIHPPHQHTGEEFLFIIEGKGTWSLKGEETEAKAGDLMYAQPWDWHGLTNTGSTTLKFFVMKWDSKGVKTPKQK